MKKIPHIEKLYMVIELFKDKRTWEPYKKKADQIIKFFNSKPALRGTLNKIFTSGIWLQPIVMISIIRFLVAIDMFRMISAKGWFQLLVLSFLPVLYIWSVSLTMPSEREAIKGKEKAMYALVPQQLLYERPTGILLGKDKVTDQYVCKPLSEDGHIFVIGGSGSGKSSCLVIPTLLANPGARVFAIDIKGELSFKSVRYGDEHSLIFNPADRNTYGYNPFFGLTGKTSSQQILETMQTISYSLIAMPAGLKDPFWKVSARNLLTGLLLYYYKQGSTTFIDVIDEILNKPIQESIQAVISNAKPQSAEYRYIIQFSSMAEETLGGIVAEMNNHLVVFANDSDIRYAFKNNSLKLNPLKLEEGYSIYLSIREEKLSAYYDVLQLILNQTLGQLEKRPENAEPVIFIIDELPRILSAGKLERLLDGGRTLRSRNVCLFLVTQSIEALMSAYMENETTDLISNCTYVVVLSASSSKTQKMICDWCGKYRAKKTSWTGAGKNRHLSVSYEEKDIVTPSDLMALKNAGEALLITPYGYSRVSKVPYYLDPILAPINQGIVKHNKTISSL